MIELLKRLAIDGRVKKPEMVPEMRFVEVYRGDTGELRG
jgi:hypothetical protein